ncbi:MAG TPA: hypothetical protein VLR27_01290 [Acidimicrobiales bacterium]|nr:hypothetical protein [Acidimicrobiales bacterium]
MGARSEPGVALVSASRLTALDAEPLGVGGGAVHRTTWTDGRSSAGVMHIDAGHHLGEHTHRRHHHHVWVVTGSTRVLGEDLPAGSYAHIPAGVEHDFEAVGDEGCTVFYLYLEQGQEGPATD